MVNVMYRNPLPDYFDNALSSARTVSLIVDQIEAAPAQVQRQQQELARLNSQINSARQSLISERAAFDAERHRVTDADDLDQTRLELEQRDVATQLEEKRGELIRVQNQIAAEGRKLEGIVKELRRLERRMANPVAGPVGGG
jgi:chromosome segregation ATPase